jgi:hypothetical protein
MDIDPASRANAMRHVYHVLSDEDDKKMREVKLYGKELYALIESLGSSREVSLALTRVEEAVMWAVKHLTR